MARIITLESPSATQNVVDNMNEDFISMDGMDGEYSNFPDNLFAPTTPNLFAPKPQSNLFNTTNLLKPTSTPSSSSGGFQMPVGASGTYPLSTPKPSGLTGFGFGSKPTATIPTATPTPNLTSTTTTTSTPKKGFWGSLFGTKEERSEKRGERKDKRAERRDIRRKNRAERRANRKNKKSLKQIKVENAAKERALKLGKSQAEANAIAQQLGEQQKAKDEQQITIVEDTTLKNALNQGVAPQVAEDLANKAGEQMEQQLFGGYAPTDAPKDEVKFWGSMSTGAKIGLIGGGVLVLGLVTWGIIAASKNKN